LKVSASPTAGQPLVCVCDEIGTANHSEQF
jgi:hypothetical protein